MATFGVIMRRTRTGQINIVSCLNTNIAIQKNVQLQQISLSRHGCIYMQNDRRLSSLQTGYSAGLTPLGMCLHNNIKQILCFGQPTSPAIYSNMLVSGSVYRSFSITSYAYMKKTLTVDKTGAEDSDKSEPKKKEKWYTSWKFGLGSLVISLLYFGGFIVYSWGAPVLDPDGNEIPDNFSEDNRYLAYFKRAWSEVRIFQKAIEEPIRDKLLPEPLSYPYMQPPYTLAIEIKDVLIHPEWTYESGWRFKKRPGLDYFLSQLGPPMFELVIYSSESGMTMEPIVNQADPQNFIMYRLWKDATRYMDNHHIKDVSCLNRDLSKVIMVDKEEESVKLQPRNALVLKKWDGNEADRTLVDLAHFLSTIGASGVEDVRTVLDYYHKFDDPLEAFKENQIKLQEEEATRTKQMAEDAKKKSWLPGLGIKK